MLNNQENQTEITIFHSPDADDAFMFYGMQCGAVSVPGFKFNHDLQDIESLNHRARLGELDVTAVSVHAFAYLADKYAIMNCGASMGGKDYGPRLIVKEGSKLVLDKATPASIKLGIPGVLTSATLALKLYLAELGITAELINLHFEKVQEAVANGEIDAGLIIHEGQITHQRSGLRTILDLGQWWWEKHALPLPLGVNIVRKALGQRAMAASSKILGDSINYSLAHRDEALDYALSYGRGLSKKDADVFVDMYVNDRTRDLGDDGRRSIELFLRLGHESGFIPTLVKPEFI